MAGTKTHEFSPDDARDLGKTIGVDWARIPLEEFRRGLRVELEHGAHDAQTNVTNDDAVTTARIALAHLKEFPDYYTRLAKMEAEAETYWAAQRSR